MPVSDATPLIYLARLGKLHLLRDIFSEVQIPPEVKNEVIDRGKEKGYSDAYVLEQALNDGWLISSPLTEENVRRSETLAQMTGTDFGEAQAIILTKQKNEREVLIDESDAREAARRLDLDPRGTIFIILAAIKKGLISKDLGKQMLAELIEVDFHMSASIYRDAFKAIEQL